MSLKKVIVSAVAATAIATSAFSADLVSKDGTGDYIVFPAYFAIENGNWSTDIRLVNTNTTHSVVAKVVIREFGDSLENLDFPVFLSPGDVWEAQLVEVNGKVTLKSDDDSMYGADGKNPANVAGNAVAQTLFDNGTRGNQYGYVEVYNLAMADAATETTAYNTAHPTAPVKAFSEGSPLDKKALIWHFETQMNGNGSLQAWDVMDSDSVYGIETISSNGVGSEKSMTLMATALENVNAGSAAANSQIVGTNSIISTAWQAPVSHDVVEDALEKDNVFVTYYDATPDETQLLMTHAMKHEHMTYTPPKPNFADGLYAGQSAHKAYYAMTDGVNDPINGGYKGYKTATFYFTGIPRDNFENSIEQADPQYSGGTFDNPTQPCVTEVCYISISDSLAQTAFTEGYVDFVMNGDDATGKTYEPAPAIMTTLSSTVVGGRTIINAYKPAHRANAFDAN